MPNLRETAKEHPVKAAAAIFASVATISSSVLFVDSRYAHADDLVKVEKQAQNAAEAGKAIIDIIVLEKEMRVMMLEIKKADPQQKLTPSEEVELQKSKEMLAKMKISQQALIKNDL